MQQQNQQTKTPLHLRLSNQDWVDCFQTLTRAELGVLYYIRTLDPFGDRSLDIETATVAQILGLHRTSVSRALEELSKRQLIELEIKLAKVRQKVNNRSLTLLTHPENQSLDEETEANESCAATHSPCSHAQISAATHAVVQPRTDECAHAHCCAATHSAIYIDRARDQTLQTQTLSLKLERQPKAEEREVRICLEELNPEARGTFHLPASLVIPSELPGKGEAYLEKLDPEAGDTFHPLALLQDPPELLEQANNLGVDPHSARAAVSPKICQRNNSFPLPTTSTPTSRARTSSSAGAGNESGDALGSAPTPYRDRTRERFSRTAAQQDWEIQPGVPYPAFLSWRSKHYISQGGHWADTALANAKSEIRNNPLRAADLWAQFLDYSNQAADNALAHQAVGMTPSLPSCFADVSSVTKEQVLPKLEALVGQAQVALPQLVATSSCTATAPYLAPSRSSTVSAQSNLALECGEWATGTDAMLSGIQFSGEHTNVASLPLPDSQPTGIDSPVNSTLLDGNSTAKAHLPQDSIPNYQEQEQNIRRLGQMIQGIKSLPKQQRRQPDPTTHLEKMRDWLNSGNPILRKEALAWAYNSPDFELVFDEQGNPYGFQEIEF